LVKSALGLIFRISTLDDRRTALILLLNRQGIPL